MTSNPRILDPAKPEDRAELRSVADSIPMTGRTGHGVVYKLCECPPCCHYRTLADSAPLMLDLLDSQEKEIARLRAIVAEPRRDLDNPIFED